jgi:arylsulfatase A
MVELLHFISVIGCWKGRQLWVNFLIIGLYFNAIGGQAEVSKRLPNIIYIFTDDLGYGDLGCFGASDIHTPNIDRMADEGIKFTNFYSASPVCSPSRAGLLTGRLPQRMGINEVFFPESFTGMPPDEITIPEMLKEKNYVSGIVGKWHLGHHEPFLPLQQGFDSYFGIPYSNDMESVVYIRGNEVETYDVDQRYITRTYTREAIQFIEKHPDDLFFLYLAHNMPHVPIYASEDFLGVSKRGLYGDVVQELDWSVGQILNKLESLNLLENTLIIFSSDNGPWLVMEELGGSAGILREGKNYTFEGGMRVPTVAMWKGTIPAGTVYEGLATQMDWFPTLAVLTGIRLPTDLELDGTDLTKVLFNTGDREGGSYLFFDGNDLQCYRKNDWKIKKPFEGYPGSPWKQAVAPHDTLLINLREDPGERNNLYATKKELAENLFREMEMELQAMGKLPPSLVVRTEADNSHLRALEMKRDEMESSRSGYIEVDGSRLDYIVEGRGKTCLVIGSSVYYPKTFSKNLREHLRMYFVDMKWFARDYTPEKLDSVTIQTIVEDVEEIRQKLRLDQPMILGHSIHGTIAMEYVKKYSEKVSSLVVIGSPSQWGNSMFDQKATALWETASDERKTIQKENWGQITELDRLTGKEEASTEYHIAAPQYWYDPHYDARWLWDGMTVHSEVTQYLFTRVFLNYDMFDPPVLIPVPVLVAMGKYDYVIPYTLWKTEYENIPDFTLMLFEKSGHTPQLEEPALFDRKFLEWMDSRNIK